MRHLWSLVAGLIAAPLAWCLIALGQSGSQEKVGEWVSTRHFDTTDLIEPALYLAAAGVVLGLIATLRISPLGPLVGGLLLMAAYIGLFISPLDVRDAVPDDWEVSDRHVALRLPLDNGTLLLIGVLLVMAVFSANRWRRWLAAAAVPVSGEPLAAGPLGGEAETRPDSSPEPERVSVGAESAPDTTTNESLSTPAWPAPMESTPSRTETPAESPWSAPPGQGRPEQ